MGTLKILTGEESGEQPVTVVHLAGDLDGNTYKEFQDKVAALIDAGSQRLLLDMSGIRYMGSAGFRALHAINNMYSGEESEKLGKSAHVKLLSPSPEVLKIIKTLGFDSYLEIHDDMAAAVASFQK